MTFLEPEILLKHPQNVSGEVHYTGNQDEGTNNSFSGTYVVCMQAVSFTYSVSAGRQMDELSWKGSKLRWTLCVSLPLRWSLQGHAAAKQIIFVPFTPSPALTLEQKTVCVLVRLKPLHTQKASV